MKTKKKVTKKSTAVVTKPTEAVPKTIREQLEKDFFKLVLEIPYAPIPKGKTLLDYAKEKDAKWADWMVQVYMDNIYMRMHVQADRPIRKKPVTEILDYLEKVKRGRIFHGWK